MAAAPAPRMAVLTRLRLRSAWWLPRFMYHTIRSERQARAAGGNLRVDLRARPGLAFETLTVWQSEGVMRAYVRATPHVQAMKILSAMVSEEGNARLPAFASSRICVGASARRDPHVSGQPSGAIFPDSGPSPAHTRPRACMQCSEAATVRIELAEDESPEDIDWDRAEDELVERGKLHRVDVPSADQAAGRIVVT